MGSKDKGGSAPTEAANTLQSKAVARILDLVSEGEIVGLYTGEGTDGKKFPFKAIYFDNVPVQSADGDFINAALSDPELNAFANLTKLNFDGVEMWERLGTPDQAVITEFSEIESERTINLQVTDASPVLFVIADDDVDAIRIKLRLPSLRTVNGDGSLVGTTLEYTIEYQPAGGSFTELVGFPDTISGKNTSPYERQILVDLSDKGLFPITFRVKRVTEDSDKATLQNDLFVNGYTEIQRAQMIYPDSALLAFRVNSELFSGRVPRRSFLVRGLKIQVPSNYFPETRLYHRDVTTHANTGTPQAWDGLFYTAWSNNPAWVLYDILTNARYGLGEFIDGDTQVDRFSLYDIGVYCDEDVDDGLGTGLMEPRYSFNGVINTREDAFDVINAITSTFRGMSFWSAAGVTAVADSPKDPKRLVTRANVVNGHFVYSGTALRAQHTAALVGYNDPTNHYKITTEVVEDASRREQFGWRELEVAAFGTTSRGQAYRLGRWIIDSEKNESELVSFTSGLELADLRPGDIIQIADPARQAVRRGGRIILHTAGTPDTIELDAPIQPFDGDDILVNNVLGGIETLPLEGENDETTTVSFKEWSAIVNFVDSGPDTIVRTDGGSWVIDGLSDGNSIAVSDAAEAGNNDRFVVDTVTASTLTLSVAATLTADTADTITFSIVPTEALQVNSIFIHRGPNLVPEEWRVLSMRETEEHTFEFSCLAYDATKFARIEQDVILPPEPTTFLPSGPLVAATNLTFFESLYKVGSSVNVKLDISWTRSTDPRVHLYRVETRYRETTSEPVTAWELQEVTPAIHAEVSNARAGLWSFRITASRSNNDFSPGLQLDDQVVVGKTAPPPNVTNLTAVRGFVEVVLDWDDVDDIDLSGYVVQRGPAWSDDPDNDPSVEVLANPVFASTYTATAKTVETKRYHVRAVDTMSPGNLSREVASVETSIQALPAVANLYAHQVDDSLRVDWDATATVANIQYEIKYGPTTGTFNEAASLVVVANSNYIGPLPVDSAQDQRIYVRPFVDLAAGNTSYGTSAYIDVSLFPLNRGFRVKSQTEEPAWSSNVTAAGPAFVLSGPDPSETMSSPRTISSNSNWNETYGGLRRISALRNGAFRITLNVSGGTPQGNILAVGTDSGYGAMSIGFDSAGNLIFRIANGKKQWFQYDTTNLIHFWSLRESSGNRVDSQGSNDLTATGTVAAGLDHANQFGAVSTSLFEATTPSYLTGTDISLAEKDWSVMFWFSPNASSDGTGQLFELGSGTTLKVELITGDRLRATVYDSTGAVSVDSLVATLADDIWVMGYVLFDHFNLTLTCGMGRALDATGTVAAGGLVDGTGALRVGYNFDGSIDYLFFFERLLDVASSQELQQMEAWMIHGSIGQCRLAVPNASIPVGVDFELVFDMDKGDFTVTDGTYPAVIRVWIDAAEFSSTQPDGLGFLKFRASSSGGLGRSAYVNEGEAGLYGGSPTNFTLESDLDYWHDQLAYSPLEVVAGELTLTEGSTFAGYEFPFNLPNERIGRLWFEMTATSIAAAPLKIFDALMTIDSMYRTEIAESTSFTPSIEVWIDIESTGTYIPLVAGTYNFKNSTIRVVLMRGENETTRPSITNFSTHFIEQPADITLQADTTDATTTTLTYDGGAVTAANIPVIPDDFKGAVKGRMIAWKDDNVDFAEYNFNAVIRRGTGVASTTVASFSIVEEETDTTWLVELVADTTFGGLNVNVTGVAGTNIKWLCDIDIVREIGSDAS